MRLVRFACCLALGSAWALGQTANSVVVEFAGDSSVSLRVTQPADLHHVLQVFCDKARFDCDLAEQSAREVVPTLFLRGSSEQVLSQLLDGQGFNYVMIAGDARHPGKLVVQPKVSGPETRPGAPTPEAQETVAASSAPEAPVTQAAASEPEQPPNADEASAAGESSPDFNEPPSGMAATPFVGPNGRPVYAPMQAPAGSMIGTPFADQNGQQVVVPAGERPQYLPFPDQYGHPIPMPPAAPAGTVTPNPLPPTPR